MAGNWFPIAQLTSSGRPIFQPGEVESNLLSSIDIESEENPNFPVFKSGVLILTTHRIIWIDESKNNNSSSSSSTSSASAISIPLGAVTHIFSPKKSIKSMFASPRIRFQVSVSTAGKVEEKGSRSMVITLVFRGSKSDPDTFVTKFWEAWRARSWEVLSSEKSDSNEKNFGSVESSSGLRMAGVSGILRKEQETWESTDKSLQDAFQDLNALMGKAKEMVMLAEKMRLKLLSGPTGQPSTTDEEMGSKQDMQDWLLSVGIASPVTKESAGALYHQQLSRQLADFVKIPLERAGGMTALIDVYCLFNRARGTELISPEDLLQACAIWAKFDVPVMLRKFDSGVMVIQNKSHSDEEVFARIMALVLKPEALRLGVSASDAAMTLGIAPALAKEHLLTAETKGLLCRDVSAEGFRFYINLFKEIDLNDIHLLKDYGVYSNWASAVSVSG
ncbi:vacuolar protein sorting-associated protein 36-like [Papaver somniferum]|uniref:vacuolar protein sorting-associated protein 36-like n=1 Tax=Papaver somniferum TaxID=3469 RepID=UPI000E6F6BBE|nr:vacuolar protein sorting-associated protein 36-like [Papaver somniferum]